MEELKEHKHKWYTFGCKDATYLITKSEYAALSFPEKLLTNFHKILCKYCRRYQKQNQKIGELLKTAATASKRALPLEKKEALNQLITKNSR